MSSLKRLTQSVTGILITVIVVATAFAMGKILDVTGVTDWIDSIWSVSKAVFWMALLISRWAFAAVWCFGDYYLVDWLHKAGWFWFKPGKPRYRNSLEEAPSIDRSGAIISTTGMIILVFAAGFIFAEAAIRLTSWTEVFYLPLE